MKPLDPRLLQYSRSSRGFIFASVFFAVLQAALIIAQSLTIANTVVAIYQRHATVHLVAHKLLWIAIFFALRALVNFLTEYVAAISSTRMRSELRASVLEKILDGRSRAIFNEGPAAISVLATKGIDSLDAYFSRFLPQLFIAVVVPVTVGITIASQDKVSGFIALVTVPLVPLFGAMIGRFTGAATQKRWQTLSLLSGYFLDLLSGLATLKVFGRSKLQEEKLQKVGDQYREETMKVLRISFLSSLALEVIATLSVALMAVTIGLRLVNGSLTLRTGLFILILAPEVYWPIRQVALYFHAASDGVEAANRIFTVLGETAASGSVTASNITEISWSQLTVNYPGRNQVLIPAGKLQPGQVNIIVGPSGAGKSTLFSILLGFHTDYEGEVKVSHSGGKHSLSGIRVQSWRSLISWLPQDVNFPTGSVRQILLHADASSTDGQLTQVLSQVGLNISDLPAGLDTQLGTMTETLSVGQKRKIALARALLKPAEILILDEPSASVDDVSESEIAAAIDSEVAKGKIVVLVTHRTNLISAPVTVSFAGGQ